MSGSEAAADLLPEQDSEAFARSTVARIPALDKLFVGGRFVSPSSDLTVDVVDPATERCVTTVAAVGVADADAAVSLAVEAFGQGQGAWSSLDKGSRIQLCQDLLDQVEARMDAFVDAWVLESGATRAYSEIINRQVSMMVWRDAIGSGQKLVVEEVRSTPTGEVTLRREPVGVVVAIYPYNAPLLYVGMKVIPALIAGCAVIAKPALESQLTTRLLCEAAASVGFPEGALSILAADSAVSQHLTGHKDVDMVSLTAGTAVAVETIRQSAPRIGRVSLELGGKAAVILGDDVDLDVVIPQIIPSMIGFGGQTCVTLSRVLVARSRYNEVVDAIAEAYRNVRVGSPLDDSTDLGPLAVERARDRTEHYVELAVKEGAKVVTGGRRPPELKEGFYYEPTLLRDVTNDMTVAREEVFGPVTAVIAYDDLDDAVRIANDSDFGLASSVFWADATKAAEVARRLRVGSVSINMVGVCITEPYGGFKQSGFGRECGIEGILGFTEIKQTLAGGGSLWAAE